MANRDMHILFPRLFPLEALHFYMLQLQKFQMSHSGTRRKPT